MAKKCLCLHTFCKALKLTNGMVFIFWPVKCEMESLGSNQIFRVFSASSSWQQHPTAKKKKIRHLG